MNKRRSTPEHERLFRDDSADPFERSEALYLVALDRLVQYEHDIARLLDHPSEDLRDEAIKALVLFFKLEAHVSSAMTMLASDPSDLVRGTAALSIGMYARTTGRKKDSIIRALVRAIETEKDGLVAGLAYDRLRELVPGACGGSRPDTLTPEDVRAMIRWEELAPYRGH